MTACISCSHTRLDMACTTQSITITPTWKPSSVVEQKHQPPMSPYPLSPPKVLPSFYCSNHGSLPKSDYVPPSFAITHPSPPILESAHHTHRLSIRSTIMSRSTEQLSVLHCPPPRQLLIQSAHALPKSVSVADLQLNERPQRFGRDKLELRRVPPSINDLRLLAQKQNSAILIPDQFKSHLANTTAPETQLCHVSNANVDYAQEQEKQKRRRRYKSYQDMHILSMYQENASLLSIPPKWTSHKDSVQSTPTAYHISDSESSRDSSPRPKTPSDRSLCENLASIKTTMSEHEKVRRVNARRVQVVEHSQRQESFHAEADEEIVSVLTCLVEQS